MTMHEQDDAQMTSPGIPDLVEPTAWREVSLVVNDQEVTAHVESRLLLSDFLRDRLQLTGTHVGCEQGACGACTVLLDGRAVRSCLTFAASCADRDITTVENLAKGDALHPLQRAFHDHHGLQCGFCTPGFLMSLAELYELQDGATEEELMDQLCGNICRCTGYRGIERAARDAIRLKGDEEKTDD